MNGELIIQDGGVILRRGNDDVWYTMQAGDQLKVQENGVISVLHRDGGQIVLGSLFYVKPVVEQSVIRKRSRPRGRRGR